MQHPADTIAEHWPDLLAARTPGTRPRYTSLARPIADAIQERDRVERAERSTLARGAAPAPAIVPVIDVIRDVSTAVRYVETETRDALQLPYLAPAPSTDTDTPSACRRILGYRRMLAADQAAWIEAQLKPAARAVLTAVGLDDRPVTLLQPCPWCRGPLTVHAISPVGPHVLCSGHDDCDAPSSTWLYGRPLWHWSDLARLGSRLTVPDRPRRALRVNLRKANDGRQSLTGGAGRSGSSAPGTPRYQSTNSRSGVDRSLPAA